MLQVVQFLSDQIQLEELVFSGASGPPSSISCTSTGRPATTVEWYRNGERIADADSTTVLNDPVTASYTYTLHLSQREGGLYKCFVNTINDHAMAQPVTTSAELNIEGENFKQFNLQVYYSPLTMLLPLSFQTTYHSSYSHFVASFLPIY